MFHIDRRYRDNPVMVRTVAGPVMVTTLIVIGAFREDIRPWVPCLWSYES